MSVAVKVWSDFVCPFCMIAERPLLDAIRESGVDVSIEWMPFELRPEPTPTLRPEDAYLQSIWPQAVYPMADQFGVAIQLPSVSPQPHTHLAWEGFQFAREKGKANMYNERMLQAFFQEDQDIGDPEVLARLAGEIGLDATAFRVALEKRAYRDLHQEALDQAEEMQVMAVPTIVVGEHRYSGVQPKEILIAALKDAARESS